MQSGVILVLALMVVSSVLNMAIRQIRHLSEKPSDFFRLPVFIMVSTAFLMPVRLIGFFRTGHASGWGIRAGAYGGGPQNDHIMDRLRDTALADAGERVESLSDGQCASTVHPSMLLQTAPLSATQNSVAPPRQSLRRRPHPKAAWPSVIGTAIFALEGFSLSTSISSILRTTGGWWALSRARARFTVVGAAVIVLALAATSALVWISPANPVTQLIKSASSPAAEQAHAARTAWERDSLQSQVLALRKQLEMSRGSLTMTKGQLAPIQQQLWSTQGQLDAPQKSSAASAAAAAASKIIPKKSTKAAASIVSPTKAQIVAPASRYFGLFTEQAPFTYATYDAAAAAIGGVFDASLHRYAHDIVATGLPLGIRLDHETNGVWYPWDETDEKGAPINSNSVDDHVKMWRHVPDIFQRDGANARMVWIWAANIVNTLPAAHTSRAFLAGLSPGDANVETDLPRRGGRLRDRGTNPPGSPASSRCSRDRRTATSSDSHGSISRSPPTSRV